MLGAGRSEFVGADAAIGGRDAPFGFDEFGFQEALQGGVEGAFFDLKEIVGGALDVLGESVAVERLDFKDAQNHHFESAGEEIALFIFFHGPGGANRLVFARPRAK